ncbi:hypothetical protein L1987_12314 [Smallanthus sonchifolius]|uniref:Uncharacterized protein n=1 Tax=Smallanthus sonchifolius TaxID=185202 RepID=A0ACB9JE03_9ASTR|nr:hypothetical protein L1987_12314 [Smallanthus sonchifolius]
MSNQQQNPSPAPTPDVSLKRTLSVEGGEGREKENQTKKPLENYVLVEDTLNDSDQEASGATAQITPEFVRGNRDKLRAKLAALDRADKLAEVRTKLVFDTTKKATDKNKQLEGPADAGVTRWGKQKEDNIYAPTEDAPSLLNQLLTMLTPHLTALRWRERTTQATNPTTARRGKEQRMT